MFWGFGFLGSGEAHILSFQPPHNQPAKVRDDPARSTVVFVDVEARVVVLVELNLSQQSVFKRLKRSHWQSESFIGLSCVHTIQEPTSLVLM